MQLALNSARKARHDVMRWRVVFGVLLPLFVAAEGVQRLYARFSTDEEPTPARQAWLTEARAQTSIATSFALMARSMLQSSERRNRPERLS